MTIYEDANIVIIQCPSGKMTIDKNTNRMISWIGMRMTIDEAIKTVSLYDGYHALDLASAMKLKKATNVLRDAAKKYQKIEDIYYHQSGEALENSLRWVIEDENDD